MKRASVFSVFNQDAENNTTPPPPLVTSSSSTAVQQGPNPKVTISDDRKYHTLSAGKARDVLRDIASRQEDQAKKSLRRIKKHGYDQTTPGTWSRVKAADESPEELIEFLLESLKVKDDDLALAAEMGQSLVQEQIQLSSQLEDAEATIAQLNLRLSTLENRLVQQRITLNVGEDDRVNTLSSFNELQDSYQQLQKAHQVLLARSEETEKRLRQSTREIQDLNLAVEEVRVRADHEREELVHQTAQQVEEALAQVKQMEIVNTSAIQFALLSHFTTTDEISRLKTRWHDCEKVIQALQAKLRVAIGEDRSSVVGTRQSSTKILDDSMESIQRERAADANQSEIDLETSIYTEMSHEALVSKVVSLSSECKRLKSADAALLEQHHELQEDHRRLKSELDLVRGSRPSRAFLLEHSSSIMSLTSPREMASVVQASLADEILEELRQFEYKVDASGNSAPAPHEIGYEFFTMLLLSIRLNFEELNAFPLDHADADAIFHYLLKHKIPFHQWEQLLIWELRSNRNMKLGTLTPSRMRSFRGPRSRIGTR